MKIKFLVCFAIISILNAPVFALEIHKGKVISSKEWTTGGARGHSVVGKYLALPKKSFLTPQSMYDTLLENNTQVYYSDGVAGVPVTIPGTSSVNIENNTSTPQTYDYFQELCGIVSYTPDKSESDECVIHDEVIRLEVGGSIQEQRDSQLQITFLQPGDYTSYLLSQINSGDDLIVSYSQSEGKIHIS